MTTNDVVSPYAYTPPEPQPGCDVCGALVRQINDADNPRSSNYDPSKATDLRVEMARHRRGEVAT